MDSEPVSQYGVIFPIMENQMEKKMENEMETELYRGYMVVSTNRGTDFRPSRPDLCSFSAEATGT